jgi:hypothetical protein
MSLRLIAVVSRLGMNGDQKKIRRWLPYARRVGGTTMFIVGIVTLPIPVIPGGALIAASLVILSIDSPDMHARIVAIRTRYRVVDRALAPGDRLFRLLGHKTPPHSEPLPFPDERDKGAGE